MSRHFTGSAPIGCTQPFTALHLQHRSVPSSLYNDWHEIVFIQESRIYAIGQRIYKETGGTGFGEG